MNIKIDKTTKKHFNRITKHCRNYYGMSLVETLLTGCELYKNSITNSNNFYKTVNFSNQKKNTSVFIRMNVEDEFKIKTILIEIKNKYENIESVQHCIIFILLLLEMKIKTDCDFEENLKKNKYRFTPGKLYMN